MFTQLAIITLPVKDQDIAQKFYVDVLGCKVLEDMPMQPGSRWIRLELPGVDTRLVLANWFKQMPAGSAQGMVLLSEDIEKTTAELQSRGVQVSAIKDQPYGREATFNDPDGNGWVIQQPPSR